MEPGFDFGMIGIGVMGSNLLLNMADRGFAVVGFDLKQERADAVMELQQGISLELNQHRVGQVLKVLVDRKEGADYVGRSEFDSPEVDNEVVIKSAGEYLRIGDFVQVKITDASEFDLTGSPLKQAL